MQIFCNRFNHQKAVEVCYWSCRFRKGCKDWENALTESPGVAAIRERLEAAAKKSGRVFDAGQLQLVQIQKKRKVATQ